MKLLRKGNVGCQVKYLQLMLKDLNLYNIQIDGIFGTETENAVKEFQKNATIDITGIVDDATWNALVPYAKVPTTIDYCYDIMMLNIQRFILKYPFLNIDSIGNSVMGKEIPVIRLGFGDNHVLYVGSTHANEWITSPLLMKFIEDFCEAYIAGKNIYGTKASEIYEMASIFIVPMLNPDGVDLVTNNMDTLSNEYIQAKKTAQNYPTISFPSGWKANISGIDLNLQFPAGWNEAKKIKFSQGYITPAPRDFVGAYPLEAPEALALYDFTINNSFNIMITYHTQGEVIYWKFLDYTPPNALAIGEKFASLSGYTLEETPYASSFAGFKDWFIQNYNRPGYTIEAGIGINPIPISQFNKIYNDNIGILVYGAYLTYK